MQSLADLDLLRKFECGERFAFDELVNRYNSKVFRLALSFLKKPEDAEEIVQDVFTRIYCKAQYFKGESAFSSWVYRITVNCCLMKIRKAKRRQKIDFLNLHDFKTSINCQVNVSAEQTLEQKEFQASLKSALEGLSAANRKIVCLRDIDGFSSTEVGDRLGISVAAVKSKLHRARAQLRKELSSVRANYIGERRVA